MEQKLKYLFDHIVPILMIIILLIPFICVEGLGLDYIHLSPLKILLEKHINNITNILFILILITYIILSYLKQNQKIKTSKRIALIATTILYFVLFKVTSNTNLNLLCVVLNFIVLIIFILNYIREYLIIKQID